MKSFDITMLKIKRPYFIFLIIYLAISLSFTFYWANHYAEYVHDKGDHFFVLAEWQLAWAYVVFLVLQFALRKVHLIPLLVVPIIMIFASLFLGILILSMVKEGTPVTDIRIYGILYGLLIAHSMWKGWSIAGKVKNTVLDDGYAGMTVNERLFVSGLLDEFDRAVAEKNKIKLIEILQKVELTEPNITPILASLGI